jgi:glutathione synthase
MIERSLTIKAPNIQYHLCCLKKIQQKLSEPNALEKFISDSSVVKMLRATFVKQYQLDENNTELMKSMIDNAESFVLKPQREGGGNNIYGNDIKQLYEKMSDKTELRKYVLMERIKYVDTENYFIRPKKKTEKQNVIVELGILGITIG